jgi:flagellar biosynthetic protein FliR
MAVAGQIAAAMIGLASVLVPDAGFGAQSSALSRMLGLLTAVLMLSSGLYALPLGALVGSYAVLPVGDAFPAGAAAEAVATAGAESLALALRLAAPFVVGAVVMNLALGLMARLAPAVQVYFVAVPGQILAGVALLGLMMPLLLAVLDASLRAQFAALPGAN